MSKVGIARTTREPNAEQIELAVREAVQHAGGLEDIVAPGALVLLKPNLVGTPAHPRNGACTSPEVCRAVADMVRELGARPVIAESSAVGVDTEEVIQFMGYGRLREAGYEVIDLKSGPTVRTKVTDGEAIRAVTLFELALQADVIISIPVLKTHDQCDVTLSLKNLKGLVTDHDKRRIHKVGLNAGISDIVSVQKPAFAVIDGIWGQEGLGPLYGMPIEMDLIIAGRDLVATDAVGCAVMDFDPKEIVHLQMAHERGLGTLDLGEIEVAGTPIHQVRRRFVRFLEDERMQMEAGPVIVHASRSCTGCRLGVGSALFEMQREGTFEHAMDLTILTGEAELPEGVPLDRIVAVGNCCPQELRECVTWVRGCPPNNIFIKRAILGMKGRADDGGGTPDQAS